MTCHFSLKKLLERGECVSLKENNQPGISNVWLRSQKERKTNNKILITKRGRKKKKSPSDLYSLPIERLNYGQTLVFSLKYESLTLLGSKSKEARKPRREVSVNLCILGELVVINH